MSEIPVEEILEKLAELEHEQWSHIIKYLLEQGCITLTRYQSFNYKQLANTPYSKLSEGQKDSDREWARKVLAIVKAQRVLKVNKLSTKQYHTIFDVHLPIRFFFNADGSFDGIEVSVEDASERDEKLADELCQTLGSAVGIPFKYTILREPEESEKSESETKE